MQGVNLIMQGVNLALTYNSHARRRSTSAPRPLSPLSSLSSLPSPIATSQPVAECEGEGGGDTHTHTHNSLNSLSLSHTSHHALFECERRSKWTSGLVNLSWSEQAEKAGDTASTNEGIFNLDIISMYSAVLKR